MFVVGLTGGIGSGKTAASDYLAKQGITVVDADVAARTVVEPGQPALKAIAKHFGQQVINAEGALDRGALRNIVFADDQQLRQLEAITHPAIETEIRRQLAAATSAYALLVSPLLLETQQHQLTHRILLIDTPESLQIDRASQRDGNNRAQIQAIIDQQMSRDQRRHHADDIVLNDASLETLEADLYALHQRYLSLAKAT